MSAESRKYILTCIRHGQTVANVEGRFIGILDQSLNEEGIKQATKTSHFLYTQGYRFDFILSSPLQRCMQTAKIIGNQFGIDIMIENSLKERNYGVFEGLNVEEVKIKYFDLYAQYEKNKPFVSLPQGETAYDVESRIKSFLEHILRNFPPGSNLLLVTHLNPIRAILRILGLADWDIYFKKFQNASITQIETDLKSSRIILFDCGIDMNC